MDILYLLIPLSVLLMLLVIGVFAWALQGGQFDDLAREGERILGDTANPQSAAEALKLDAGQGGIVAAVEQSDSAR